MSFLLPELTALILPDLSRDDILQCMKTCKGLYSSLAPMYYYKIKLQKKDHRKFLQACEHVRVDGSKIGDFIQELVLSKPRGRTKYLDEDEFHRLIENLPALEKFVLWEFAYTQYLPYFKTIPPTSLQQIREISIANDAGHLSPIIHDHFWANYRFKDRINTLVCSNFNILEYDFNVLKRLSEFSCLQNLEIDNVWLRIGLFPILNACNNLISFKTRCNFRWETFEPPEKTIVHKNLTTLEMGALYVTNQHVDYMIQCMPNLHSLKLCILSNSIIDILSTLGEEDTKKFQQYLAKINKLEIRNIEIPPFRVPQNTSNRTKLLMDLARDVCDHGTLCNFKTQFTRLPLKREYFILDKDGQTVNITGIWIIDIFTHTAWTDQLEFLNFKSFTMINTCHRMKTFFPHVSQAELVNTCIIKPLLALLLRKQACPILIRSFRQRLVFKSTLEDPDFYPSEEDGNVLRRHHLNSGNKPFIVDYGFASRVLLSDDVLNSLGQLYPFVQWLVLEKCTFENKERTKHYHINLSRFNNIGLLTFDLDAILSIRKLKQPLYILFVSAENSTDLGCYYYEERDRNILQRLNDFNESDIPQSAYVIKISHIRIRLFIFKRRNRTIYKHTMARNLINF